MLKKTVLLFVIFLWFFTFSLSASAWFKELSSWYVTENECIIQKDFFNTEHTSDIRSDCFLVDNNFHYYLCDKMSFTCNISSVSAENSLINSFNPNNPYWEGMVSLIIPRLQKIYFKLMALSPNKLEILLTQIDAAIIDYSDKKIQLQVLNYLKFEVKNSLERLLEITSSELDTLCSITWDCIVNETTEFDVDEALLTLREKDTKVNGFWLFSNKTLTWSVDWNTVYIVDAWKLINATISMSSFPSRVNWKDDYSHIKDLNSIYAIRLQAKKSSEWLYGSFTLNWVNPLATPNEEMGWYDLIAKYSFSTIPWNIGSSEFEWEGCVFSDNSWFTALVDSTVTEIDPAVRRTCIIAPWTYFYLNVQLTDSTCLTEDNNCDLSAYVDNLMNPNDEEELTLLEQDTHENGYWLLSNKTLTWSVNWNTVYIVDAWKRAEEMNQTILPSWINWGEFFWSFRDVNSIYSIRLNTDTLKDHWINGLFSVAGNINTVNNGKIIDYTISKEPWSIWVSDFSWNWCSSIGYSSIDSKMPVVVLESLNTVNDSSIENVCIIPHDTNFYLNIKLIDWACDDDWITCNVWTQTSISLQSSNQTVENPPIESSIITKSATLITQTGAQINANILNNNANDLNISFNFGVDSTKMVEIWNTTITVAMDSFHYPKNWLEPNTQYYYQVILKDSEDNIVSSGDVMNFITLEEEIVEIVPSIITTAATDITQNSAKLRADISTENQTDLVWSFNFGLTTDTLISTSPINIQPSWDKLYPTKYNLQPNTQYFYQWVLKTSDWTLVDEGSIKNFTTASPVIVEEQTQEPTPAQTTDNWPSRQDEIAEAEWNAANGWWWKQTFSGLELDSSNGQRIRKWWYTLNSEWECSWRGSSKNIYTDKCTCSWGYTAMRDTNGYASRNWIAYVCINSDTWIVDWSCGSAQNTNNLTPPSYSQMCSSWVPSIYALSDPNTIFWSKQQVYNIWSNIDGWYDGANITTGNQFTWRWSCRWIWPNSQTSPTCSAKYNVIAKEATCWDLPTSWTVAPSHNLCGVWNIVWSVEYNRGVWQWFCVWEWFWKPKLCRMIKEDRVVPKWWEEKTQCYTWDGVTLLQWESLQLYNPLTSAHNYSLNGYEEATCKAYTTTCINWVLQSQEAKNEYSTLWFEGAKWYKSKTACLRKADWSSRYELTFSTNLRNITEYSYVLNYSDKNDIIIDISRYNDNLEPSSFNKELSFNFNALSTGQCTDFMKHGSWRIISQDVLFNTNLKFCKESGWKLWIYHRVKRKQENGEYVFDENMIRHWIIELKQPAKIEKVWDFVDNIPGKAIWTNPNSSSSSTQAATIPVQETSSSSDSEPESTYNWPYCKLWDTTIWEYRGPFYDSNNNCEINPDATECTSGNRLWNWWFSPAFSAPSINYYKSKSKCLADQ